MVHLRIRTAFLKSSKLLTVDLSTRQRKVVLFTVLLAIVGLLCQQFTSLVRLFCMRYCIEY